MKLRKYLLAGLAVPLAAAGAVAALSGAAAAVPAAGPTTGAIQPVVTDTSGFAGYTATAGSGTDFTHFSTYFGAGNPQYSTDNPTLTNVDGLLNGMSAEQFYPATTGSTTGEQVERAVEAAGIQFGSRKGDQFAALGVVRDGSNNDVLAVIDHGDTVYYSLVLIAPDADTLGLNLLHNADAKYVYASQSEDEGSVTFSAEDLSAADPTSTAESVNSASSTDKASGAATGVYVNHSFHIATAGVLSGARESAGGVASFTSDPAPDTTAGIVARLAHLHLNANADAGEVYSEGFQTGESWTVTPYAAANSDSTTDAVPTVFSEDHFSVVELARTAS